MKDQFISLIAKRLHAAKIQLKKQFHSPYAIQVARHFVLDDLLPVDIATSLYQQFPVPKKMRLLNSRGELKLKYSHIKNTALLLQDLHFAIQHPHIISIIEEITEIKNQLPDTSRLAGGVSTLLKGHYINPHLDNSHDIDRKFYRTVNMLYYVSPEWKIENGGNYELWDTAIQNRIIVPSFFNRLVVMETNRTSWHAVNPVLCQSRRCCIFNYYFSKETPENEDYFHTAALFFNPLIRPRPEQKIRRAIAMARDSLLGRKWK
ncbi:MAG: 2OG-Fe(II) oxygenase [Gammaproteobacteria bacterium]|nr:2OG-Fe(II) oxygenase [Gammaproteobacteria bacterium]